MGALVGAAILTCLVVSLVALFAGGWTAALLAKRTSAIGSMLHGVLVWALGTLVVEAVGLTSLGLAIGGSMSLVSAALRTGMDDGNLQGPARAHAPDADGTSASTAAEAIHLMTMVQARLEIARALSVLDGQSPADAAPALP